MLSLVAFCILQGLLISQAHGDRVAVYSDTGHLLRSAFTSELLPDRITQCNNSLGLVKLERSGVWVDPIEFKLPSRR